jgi:hypothetical protein
LRLWLGRGVRLPGPRVKQSKEFMSELQASELNSFDCLLTPRRDDVCELISRAGNYTLWMPTL